MSAWPIEFDEVLAAKQLIDSHLPTTAARHYGALDELVGNGMQLWVKHENHQPTGSFKIRNGLAATAALTNAQRARGIVAASRGNHGQGLAYAGRMLGIATTICVPIGNSKSKNRAMQHFGATLIEEGRDYDEAAAIANELVEKKGMTLVHSTNNKQVIAGAATTTLEFLQQVPTLDAMIIAIGGGSIAVGALTVARKLQPKLKIYGVQAAAASAIHDSYHTREERSHASADTIADGLATRSTYSMTFPTLCEGLADFVVVSEAEIAAAVRAYLRETGTLAEGAGATSLAGAIRLAPVLASQKVGIVLSGGNIDEELLLKIIRGDYQALHS